ncbi:MAG: hypothetical protein GF368_00550 [Candidatus Aenigmarchaeota archaeon]|nr:hypothetical protein [Candidatus Aenigmarchaeota archaeon]
MSPSDFDMGSIIDGIYGLGPDLRTVVRRFNRLPEDEAIEKLGSLYQYLGSIDPDEVSEKIDELRRTYDRIPGIAKKIAGVEVADNNIREFFDNTELMIAALAARFYLNGKPKEKQFESEQEHQEWAQDFREYLERELYLILGIYPVLRNSGPIMKRLRKAMAEYGKEDFLDELPGFYDMRNLRDKIISIYDLFEEREFGKYV